MNNQNSLKEEVKNINMENNTMTHEEMQTIIKRANESVTKSHEEGAKIERERIIEKACEWLESNLCCYDENYRGIDSGNSLIEDFKQAMEE